MRLLPIQPLGFVPSAEAMSPRRRHSGGSSEAHHNANLVHRTPNDNSEAPDPRFWTDYDHFMFEREARAQRREYVYRLIARAWRKLEQRLRPSSASSGRTHTAG